MNNKGMTLVELLITFSLLMIIVVGMFNLILDVKMDLDDKQIAKEISEYSNFLNGDIHYELITKQPIAIALKMASSDDWNIKYNTNYNNSEVYWQSSENEDDPNYTSTPCGITDNVFRVNSIQKAKSIKVKGEKNIANVCSNFYPCAIYVYYDSQNISSSGEAPAIFKSIAVNDTNSDAGYSIKYNNVMEKLPHPESIDFAKTKIAMKFEGDFFVMDYPMYLADDKTNYGFKIAYPVSSIAKTETQENET